MDSSSLKELHQLHIQLQDVHGQIERGPQQVKARQQFLERKQAELEQQQEQLTQAKMHADGKGLQLKTNEAKISELRAKLNAASSNREYDVIRAQIDADSMANSVLEDEILEALDKVDRLQKMIDKSQQDCAKAEAEVKRISDEVGASEPDLKARAAQLEASLKEVEKQLMGEAALVYRRLVQAHGAGALAAVQNKACTACYALLSPNMNVELNTGKVLFCRSCGRLLYRADED